MTRATPPETQIARAEATRDRIEAVAETLFRTIGYQKTTVADIARELAMSPANVYRFYPSKSAINQAIAARLLSGMEHGAWEIARGPGTPPERLIRLLRFLHEYELSRFFTDRRLHDMVSAAMTEHWDVVERSIHTMIGAIRHVVMDGMSSGDFARADPEATAMTIKHAFMMFNHPMLVADCIAHGQTEETLSGELDRLIAFTLRALRP